MQLAELLAELPGIVAISGPTDIPIDRVVSDSRQVTPGALFVAYQGIGIDGHRFIPDALRRGASAVVGEQDVAGLPVTCVQVADGRAALAWLAAAWQGHPSRDMILVGITGTDGKTTTANLLFSILHHAGRRASMISTVNAVIGDQTYDTGLHTTTPDAPDVQRYLAEMRDAGTEVAVLEVTSHGLAQHRVTGCAFDVAVYTNITHEHLDFHGSYAEYRAAKARLLRGLASNPYKPAVAKTAVLNRDDGAYAYLAPLHPGRTITYGLQPVAEGQAAHPDHLRAAGVALTATGLCHTPRQMTFQVEVTGEIGLGQVRFGVATSLIGAFNVSNILAAASAALALAVPVAAIQQGVRAVAGVPGRMERIDCGQPFTAIVDFAHTPNALEQALVAVRDLAEPGGRVIAVFGSAGLRDRAKRRLMGEVAGRLADYTVITAEDPRTEDLSAIMAESAAACAAAGRTEGREFVRIPDRQRALLHAAGQARPGDVLIACGKGHEQSMCFGATEHAWRDQDALRWALARVQGTAGPEPPFVLPTWLEQ